MRIASSLFVASLTLFLRVTPAASQDADVLIETSRSLYEPGEVVQATVTNKRSGAIFVAGCGAVTAQALRDETYRAVRGAPCVTEGGGIKIEPGKSHAVEFSDPGRSGEVRRLAVAFGWGCAPGRPLTQARCTDFSTAVSASFRVGRRTQDDE